jgi:hypothetical protein
MTTNTMGIGAQVTVIVNGASQMQELRIRSTDRVLTQEGATRYRRWHARRAARGMERAGGAVGAEWADGGGVRAAGRNSSCDAATLEVAARHLPGRSRRGARA